MLKANLTAFNWGIEYTEVILSKVVRYISLYCQCSSYKQLIQDLSCGGELGYLFGGSDQQLQLSRIIGHLNTKLGSRSFLSRLGLSSHLCKQK